MKKGDMVEVWGDIVDTRSLIYSIFISSLTTMAGYFIAPEGRELFLGLMGAVLGFIANSLIIRPKRVLRREED